MDGSSNVGGDGFLDDLDPWSQEAEYQDIKSQNQLTKQHFASPAGSPRNYVADSTIEGAKPVVLPKMDEPAIQTTPDFSEFEKLSSEYRPETTGPMVGEIKSSKALEVEYANADPAFVRKTIALSPKYSHYRTIRGDGSCGWRALAFGYFELLLRTGDANRIGMEHARVTSLNNLMDAAGFTSYLYEDFAESTFSLFGAISASPVIDNPFDDNELLTCFNEAGVSNAIITHFKLLTSSWMKTRPEYYQPWLDRTVKEYCETQVEPYAVEIDHVGLIALIDCLIIPAGFAVEVFYLDRSPGDEVNIHRFENTDGEGVKTPADAATLRLLYRPGHYDIVYKKGDIQDFAQQILPQEPVQVSFMQSLPEQNFAPTPLSFFSQNLPQTNFGIGFLEPGPSNFRPSMFNLPAFQPAPLQSLPFQTTTFRNSPFNPSHFQSENFQPELYQPPTPSSSTKRGSSDEDQEEVWDPTFGCYFKDEYSTYQ